MYFFSSSHKIKTYKSNLHYLPFEEEHFAGSSSQMLNLRLKKILKKLENIVKIKHYQHGVII